MSRLIVLIVVVLAGATAVYAARGQDSGSKISITTTLEAVQRGPAAEARYFLLWNKNIRTRPIGHSLYGCERIDSIGRSCVATYVLPLGKIGASGMVHGFDSYTLIITGGTRRYLDADGTVTARRVGPGTYALSFSLR